jgi:transcriptional regulator with PAS, ATPase and Fis domain
VRELRHVLERAWLATTGDVLKIASLGLPSRGRKPGVRDEARGEAVRRLAVVEREEIRRALRVARSKVAAAKLLGISRKTLARKIKEYRL